jgi:hypothetical protein
MPRPEFITDEDINRWSLNIDNDKNFSKELISSPIIREVCYAGLWLAEELTKLDCPEYLITSIQYTAGNLSFGRDTWMISQLILEKYNSGELVLEVDSDSKKLN